MLGSRRSQPAEGERGKEEWLGEVTQERVTITEALIGYGEEFKLMLIQVQN